MLESQRVHCCVFEFGKQTLALGNDPNMIRSYLGEMGYQLRNLFKGDPIFPGVSR